MSVGLKICGVTRAQDVQVCVDLEVDAIGLNLWPGSRRHVEVDVAAALAAVARASASPPSIVGVFVDPTPDEVARAMERVHLDYVQLHSDTPPAAWAALGWSWVQVIRGPRPLSRLRVSQPRPSWVLLDAAVAGYGGQGTRLDWEWAHDAVAALSGHAVWLAGGIRPDNAAEAIARVRPAGLDVASGAEVDGDPRRKDPAKIAALRRICQNAPQ